MKMKFLLAIQALVSVLTKKILGRNVFALCVESDNGLFAVSPEDYGVGRKLRMSGKYGLDEIERVRPYITQGDRVLIVGANVGTLAIPLSKMCKEVVAIEANPNTYKLLKMNIILNSVVNCHAINIAASDKNEHIDFLLNRANSGGSKRAPKISKYMYYYDNPEKISIQAVSLDEYLDNKDFAVIIMDIEGSEYFALHGMQEILSKCKLLVVEFLPHHLKYVAGVTVEQFLEQIQPHFKSMTIPSKQLKLMAPEFLGCLTEMYNLNQEDSGIMFESV